MSKKNLLIATYCLFTLFFSCNTKKSKPIPVHFQRYDKALFSKNIDSLLLDYPLFTPFYMQNIIRVGNPTDSSTAVHFQKFIDTYKNSVYDSIKENFSDMSRTETELGYALSNYKSIFPQDSLPRFFTHFSGFNESIIATDNIISVSIENFLGNSSLYDKLAVFKYLRKGMYTEKIPTAILKMILLKKTNPAHATDNLLSAMVYQGKIYYTLHQLFKEKELSFLLNYTEKQEKWCKANEPIMWRHLIENKHLFSSDYRVIRGYIDPAPFTRGFPNESPGQTGIWIGYHIVKNYIENTHKSLPELLHKTDYQDILRLSAYNPE